MSDTSEHHLSDGRATACADDNSVGVELVGEFEDRVGGITDDVVYVGLDSCLAKRLAGEVRRVRQLSQVFDTLVDPVDGRRPGFVRRRATSS